MSELSEAVDAALSRRELNIRVICMTEGCGQIFKTPEEFHNHIVDAHFHDCDEA
jgi:hypothetical protein